jgi:hypothetical protein
MFVCKRRSIVFQYSTIAIIRKQYAWRTGARDWLRFATVVYRAEVRMRAISRVSGYRAARHGFWRVRFALLRMYEKVYEGLEATSFSGLIDYLNARGIVVPCLLEYSGTSWVFMTKTCLRNVCVCLCAVSA